MDKVVTTSDLGQSISEPFLRSRESPPCIECSRSWGSQSTKTWRKKLISIYVLAVFSAVGIITIVWLLALSRRPECAISSEGWTVDKDASSTIEPSGKYQACGNSSAQARKLGCRFDQLTWSWLPPNCPGYAGDEFMAAAETPWIFYEDAEASKVVQEDVWEQVLDGRLGVYGERREHVTHCIFMFLGLAQIVRDKTPYHERYANYEHSRHCAYLLLDVVRKSAGWNHLDTFTGLAFFDQTCGK